MCFPIFPFRSCYYVRYIGRCRGTVVLPPEPILNERGLMGKADVSMNTTFLLIGVASDTDGRIALIALIDPHSSMDVSGQITSK